MPAKHRLVLEEFYLNGKSYQEIATMFGLTEPTVRGLERTAMRKIKKNLGLAMVKDCTQCGIETSALRFYCSIKCAREAKRVITITREELLNLVGAGGYRYAAKQLQVRYKVDSGWAYKYLKRAGIPNVA